MFKERRPAPRRHWWSLKLCEGHGSSEWFIAVLMLIVTLMPIFFLIKMHAQRIRGALLMLSASSTPESPHGLVHLFILGRPRGASPVYLSVYIRGSRGSGRERLRPFLPVS